MKHNKQDYVAKCIEANLSPMLIGPRGTGKTTILLNITEQQNKKLCLLSGTKQTTVGHLLGFISVNGDYIHTQFRDAVENGHYFLLDEIDAMDSNVLLTLNMLENGKISFPDQVVDIHPDFRFMSTANPTNEHAAYTGRSKLDASSIDRHYQIPIHRDSDLETELTSPEIAGMIADVRHVLESNGTAKELTMRDAIRIHTLHSTGISEDPLKDVIFHDDPYLHGEYHSHIQTRMQQAEQQVEDSKTQADATTVDELWGKVQEGK